jgi:hypothetical protein
MYYIKIGEVGDQYSCVDLAHLFSWAFPNFCVRFIVSVSELQL